jgi:hypothetical protein
MYGAVLNGLTLETFKVQLVLLVTLAQREQLVKLDLQVLTDNSMFQQLHQAVLLLAMYGSTQTTHAIMFTTILIGLNGLTLILDQQVLSVQQVLQV